MNANRLWRQYNIFRVRKIKQHYPAVYSALKLQIQHFVDYRDLNLPMQPMADAIQNIYLDAGRLWAFQSYLNIMRDAGLKKSWLPDIATKARMPIGFNEDFINSILEYFRLNLLDRAVLPITNTTKKWIEQQLAEGQQQGKSIDEIVKEIVKPDFPKYRAEVITRTEVARAANYGETLGVKKTGLQTQKVWIAVNDKRTRHDHRNVNGQTVDSDAPFTVGLEKFLMQHPCASKSDDGRDIPGKEVIMCRCCTGRKVLRGANGLPLREPVN